MLWANRAEARFNQKKYDGAVQDWAKAAELDPAEPNYIAKLGSA